ncbi:MAG TPA: type VI secretion system tube protein Hcp [Planctomycetaceae bacterium]|nr:type VI secretion system tube protein Hcp [Planctomycetaceae bacterium]
MDAENHLRYLLKLEGIEGEVKTKGYEGTIEIDFDGLDVFGSNHQPSNTAAPRSGQVNMSGLRLSKAFDKTSAALFRKTLASSEVIKKVTLTAVSLASQKVFEMELDTVTVGSWKTGKETRDKENVTLHPLKITLQSFDVQGKPSSKCTYNLVDGSIT